MRFDPAPYGGVLCDLMAPEKEAEGLKAESVNFPSVDLTERQVCDLELLLNGGMSPLRGFMTSKDYTPVVEEMRLDNGVLWPIPITLSVTPATAETLSRGSQMALREPEGMMLACLEVEEIWEPDLQHEAEACLGTLDQAHPMVRELLETDRTVYVGGRVVGIQEPSHHDFRALRHTPAILRQEFQHLGWRHVVGFQTRKPLHRGQKELTMLAAAQVGAHLLLHPVVGMSQPGDLDHFTRVRCYQAISSHYPPDMMKLSLLNLAMRMAGPREALWHAIIRKNYGCTHFMVGKNHASPQESDARGKPFYGPFEAQELLAKHEEELGIAMVPVRGMAYVRDKAQYLPVDQLSAGEETLAISDTELRRRLTEGLEIPDWFSYPDVIEHLRRSLPPKNRQGITLFLTGFSGAGKSTIAQVLFAKFLEVGKRPVTLLDGDIVRKNLSSQLGFSREHRDLNILRIGFVANEITKNGGIAICAPIAPYQATRREVRRLVGAHGAFIEIYVSTPIEVCEARDRKGMYAQARQGIIKNFTGVSDPYETPVSPEISIDTTHISPDEAAQEIFLYLEKEGYLI